MTDLSAERPKLSEVLCVAWCTCDHAAIQNEGKRIIDARHHVRIDLTRLHVSVLRENITDDDRAGVSASRAEQIIGTSAKTEIEGRIPSMCT